MESKITKISVNGSAGKSVSFPSAQESEKVDDLFFTSVTTDADGAVLSWTESDGTFGWASGVPDPVRKYASEEIKSEIEKAADEEPDAAELNKDRLPALYAACRQANKSKDFQLLIVTDTHGNHQALTDAVKLANSMDSIDAIIHCGDIVAANGKNEISYARRAVAAMAECEKPWLICVGNHDAGNTSWIPYGLSHADVWETYVKPMADGGVLKPDGYSEGKSYYYRDFETAADGQTPLNTKIRLIVLYEFDQPMEAAETECWKPVAYDAAYPAIESKTYEYSSETPTRVNCPNFPYFSFELKKTAAVKLSQYGGADSCQPQWKTYRGAQLIRKEQAEWLRDTLLSTPEGWGVVVATHNPFSKGATNQASYAFGVDEPITGASQGQYSMETDLVADACAAYNKREKLAESVRILGGVGCNSEIASDGSKCYYELTADFSRAKATVLGFVGGHAHKDLLLKDEKRSLWGVNPICGATDDGNSPVLSAGTARKSGSARSDLALTATSWAAGRLGLARLGNLYGIGGKRRDVEVVKL